DQSRKQHRHQEQAEHHGAAVAEQVEELLAGNDGDGLHAALASPVRLTNTFSRSLSPVVARSSSGVPIAFTSPPAMTTIRSHKAATSCMMWLEKMTQCPSARSPRRK